MSEKKVYVALHQVRHGVTKELADGKKETTHHKVVPGKPIELTDEEAAPLLARKHIRHSDPKPELIIQLAPVLGTSTLTKLTKDELVAHAKAAGVAHAVDANRDAILASFAAHVDAVNAALPKE